MQVVIKHQVQIKVNGIEKKYDSKMTSEGCHDVSFVFILLCTKLIMLAVKNLCLIKISYI